MRRCEPWEVGCTNGCRSCSSQMITGEASMPRKLGPRHRWNSQNLDEAGQQLHAFCGVGGLCMRNNVQLASGLLLNVGHRRPSHDEICQAERTKEIKIAASECRMRAQVHAKDVNRARKANLQEEDCNAGQTCLLTCADRLYFPAQQRSCYTCFEGCMTVLLRMSPHLEHMPAGQVRKHQVYHSSDAITCHPSVWDIVALAVAFQQCSLSNGMKTTQNAATQWTLSSPCRKPACCLQSSPCGAV